MVILMQNPGLTITNSTFETRAETDCFILQAIVKKILILLHTINIMISLKEAILISFQKHTVSNFFWHTVCLK